MKVISGGQTGVDQLAIEVAYIVGLKTGGYAPDGFMTTKGKNPKLGSFYGLEELGNPKLKIGQQYVERSKKNVDISDATLAFRFHDSPGTNQTIAYCMTGNWNSKLSHLPSEIKEEKHEKFHRPVFVVDDEKLLSDKNREHTRNCIIGFLQKYKVKTLNVAGHRDLERDVERDLELLLYRVFCQIKD